ncbi:pyruvate decarboxylase-like protein [Penicillium taxi]|uniref:pyruvate decarboxylase-like protein n=1 Tax=Penicillium taxi TaxID=168475 RepID=UPI00254598F9|nr:pyruvate decarboxylase-like protein [Penicillium taxi]KAJ5901468.1 pyruvate decarboxylase-like protein [Penicillium taxi]
MPSRSTVSVAQYLFARIKELGVQSVHGVPGDYNLVSLDYVSKAGLRWVGNCNELNAGYAADGYARVHGISALMTVAGVGELSASNAIAGAYAEYVPIVHIVGQPSLKSQQQKKLLHHSLGDGNFMALAKISERTVAKSVQILCAKQAPGMIDDIITQCWNTSRPVSIILPTDMVHTPISAANLARPLRLSGSENDRTHEAHAVDDILAALRAAQQPVLLVGGYNMRFTRRREVISLSERLGLPIFLSPSGRGIIDEQHPNFNGLYLGDCSKPHVIEMVRSADLIISIGNIHSDLNVASVSWDFDPLRMVEVQNETVHIRGKTYRRLNSDGLLQALLSRSSELVPTGSCEAVALPSTISILESSNVRVPAGPSALISAEPVYGGGFMKGVLRRMSHTLSNSEDSDHLSHDWLWPTLSAWLLPEDTIIAETGTSNFGIWSTKFPRGVTFISQYVWASIGYSLGACQGAAAAVQDSMHPDRRTILFIGDGSFQFTCQELSTIIKNSLTPIIFVICNKGYTVERLIHGMHESYNDIQEWQYRKLLEVFGAERKSYQTHQIRTKTEFSALLKDPSFNSDRVLRFIELHMDQNDAPSDLKTLTEQLIVRDSQKSKIDEDEAT